MKNIAEFVSWIFNPLFVPFYGLLLILNIPANHASFEMCVYFIPQELKIAIIYVFSLFGLVAPGLSFLFLKKIGVISSLYMDDPVERQLPVTIVLIYSFLLYFLLLYKTEGVLPKIIYIIPISITILMGVILILNRFMKVSIHTASAGFLVGLMFVFMSTHVSYPLWPFSIGILISGIVFSSRFYLKKHSWLELITGWILGSFIIFTTYKFY